MSTTLTVIGSGTLVPSGERSSPCHLIESGDTLLLLDAGPGAVHGLARHGKPWWKVSHLVLTHFHTDHFADLPHLLFALKWASPSARTRPLHVIGPPGLRARTEALRTAHGEFITEPGFDVVYIEVARDGTWTDGSVTLHFTPTRHTDHSVAVRVELAGHAAGYTGDTGPDPALGSFLRGCEVLVSECALADPATATNHLSPASVAELARAANPANLVLTHLYPPLDAAAVPALVRAAGYPGQVICARDGQQFTIGEMQPCSS
ncbi:MAG: ribonuclease Z [Gemmatimonadetes bacterium]|nr:ribonuclease Z [Gemmatimonadota bacterium]